LHETFLAKLGGRLTSAYFPYGRRLDTSSQDWNKSALSLFENSPSSSAICELAHLRSESRGEAFSAKQSLSVDARSPIYLPYR
jgi:hypothetical protein